MGAARRLTSSRLDLAVVEFDAFSVAVALAVVVGGLALAAPYLSALTVSLAALAIAGWTAGIPRPAGGWRGAGRPARWAAVGLVVAGGCAFLALPAPFALARGLVLALSLVPLWLVERRSGFRRGVAPREAS